MHFTRPELDAIGEHLAAHAGEHVEIVLDIDLPGRSVLIGRNARGVEVRAGVEVGADAIRDHVDTVLQRARPATVGARVERARRQAAHLLRTQPGPDSISGTAAEDLAKLTRIRDRLESELADMAPSTDASVRARRERELEVIEEQRARAQSLVNERNFEPGPGVVGASDPEISAVQRSAWEREGIVRYYERGRPPTSYTLEGFVRQYGEGHVFTGSSQVWPLRPELQSRQAHDPVFSQQMLSGLSGSTVQDRAITHLIEGTSFRHFAELLQRLDIANAEQIRARARELLPTGSPVLGRRVRPLRHALKQEWKEQLLTALSGYDARNRPLPAARDRILAWAQSVDLDLSSAASEVERFERAAQLWSVANLEAFNSSDKGNLMEVIGRRIHRRGESLTPHPSIPEGQVPGQRRGRTPDELIHLGGGRVRLHDDKNYSDTLRPDSKAQIKDYVLFIGRRLSFRMGSPAVTREFDVADVLITLHDPRGVNAENMAWLQMRRRADWEAGRGGPDPARLLSVEVFTWRGQKLTLPNEQLPPDFTPEQLQRFIRDTIGRAPPGWPGTAT